MLGLRPTYRNAGYCCTGSAGMSVQVTFGQPACLLYFLTTSSPGSLPQGQQTYLLLRMFDYMALDQHTDLKPSSYVCNSFTRLAGMLQYPFLNVALNQQVCLLQLHPTTWHVGYSLTRPACMSVRVASTSRYD